MINQAFKERRLWICNGRGDLVHWNLLRIPTECALVADLKPLCRDNTRLNCFYGKDLFGCVSVTSPFLPLMTLVQLHLTFVLSFYLSSVIARHLVTLNVHCDSGRGLIVFFVFVFYQLSLTGPDFNPPYATLHNAPLR